jgi:membrane-bound lytic murein transglycosylase A
MRKMRRRLSRGGVRTSLLLMATLVLAACVTRPAQPPIGPSAPPPIGPAPVAPSFPAPAADSPAILPGWADEDHLSAFNAWVAGCGVSRETAARVQCERAKDIARTSRPVTPTLARAFFEAGFSVVAARTADGTPGMLTAYFAPEYEARRRPDRVFDTPVLAAPAGWRRGATLPERSAIEANPPTQALAWMKAEDLFFMQIQGSGYLTFEDGSKARAAYAADNGHTFVGIARPMTQQGLLPANGTSGEAIRGWLASHRGPQAQAVMALNPRYIFFSMDPDDGGDPNGAAGVPLPARRSIAVDPTHWRYGELVWISADGGNLAGARASYQGLVVALDTGSAIRGPVRADLYMGRGHAAGEEAGAVRHPLRMWRLVPRS